jgi:hypothetical protein
MPMVKSWFVCFVFMGFVLGTLAAQDQRSAEKSHQVVLKYLGTAGWEITDGTTFVKPPPNMKDKKSMATDADIMWYGIDRVVHTKTGGGHEKVDTYKDLGEALAKFEALHATMIEYIKTTKDDLRAHSFGDQELIDCWQWRLEISTHAERHIQQIREIKVDPNFPKK